MWLLLLTSHAGRAKAKVMAKAFKCGTGEGFSEDIRGIVIGPHADDSELVEINEVADRVVFRRN
jgi:hypothetical protein